ncbi:DUF1513 domain-containing protein [Roseovarius sp. EL26]|uniref:DUF1513 domain-containing protein n=1 Tax=Roseovarius sp. EL26 TaxID=2126672 RepID=UPI000EA07442|nr:DUF1513 domain-containing protein [Roseovarius sp. EL26]
MSNRRTFLSGLLAATFVPRPTWAHAGAPACLAAAKTATGYYALCGLREDGELTFTLPLPGRGHAAAAHPNQPYAVAFARRPGRFALVIDCQNGQVRARLDAPEGRHFYGHGCFSLDGKTLFTTENDYDSGHGVIGLWDAANGYHRIGEFQSGGIGPHDLRLMPDGQALVVANGGIETHPESGRAKLNLPSMQSNLSYLSLTGDMIEQATLPPNLRLNSIRHLAVSPTGRVALAMQWQGDLTQAIPLAGFHIRGQDIQPLTAQPEIQRQMAGYAGSIAISADGTRIASTSPRGGLIQTFNTSQNTIRIYRATDVCGISYQHGGFSYTTGTGVVGRIMATGLKPQHQHALAWDNHLVRL